MFFCMTEKQVIRIEHTHSNMNTIVLVQLNIYMRAHTLKLREKARKRSRAKKGLR